MIRKNIIISILFLLLTNLSVGENQEVNDDRGNNVNRVNNEIENIIKNSLTENESSEKDTSNKNVQNNSSNSNENNERNGKSINTIEENNVLNENVENQTKKSTNNNISEKNSDNNYENEINETNSDSQNMNSNVNTNNNRSLLNNRAARKPKQPILDKNKVVVEAEEREVEGESDYNRSIIKYVVNRYGQVIKKENEKVKHPIASLTKVMNALVTLDQVDKGNVSLNDKVCFDRETANIGGSWLNVRVGDCYTLEELLRAELIYSANNAAYLIAKHVGKGNIDNFITLMNEKAKQLGMIDTEFYTPAGLPTSMTRKPMDISTAYDLSLMAIAAVNENRIVEWASETFFVVINNKNEQVLYKNRNTLLGIDGIYGLKTGFHNLAGYNIIVTSSEGNMDIISIGLGYETSKQRHNDQAKEIEKAKERVVKKYNFGDILGVSKLKWAKKREISGYLSEDVYVFDEDLNGERLSFNILMENEIKVSRSGINRGDTIGKLQIINKGNIVSEVDILSSEDVQGLSWFGKLLRILTFGWI